MCAFAQALINSIWLTVSNISRRLGIGVRVARGYKVERQVNAGAILRAS